MSPREVVLPEEVPRLRSAATVLLVVTAPFAMVGVGLTLTVTGAFVGVPMLALAVPAASTAWRARRTPDDPRRRRRAFVCALLFASALVVIVAACSVVGWDDLDTGAELSLYALAIIWSAASVWAAYVLWPVVQLDSGTSSGNRPQALSGSTSSTPSS